MAIPVAIMDDSTQESSETVVLTLTPGGGYTVGSPSAHRLTITANDAPTASLASGSQSMAEGGGTEKVQVNLRPAPTASFTLSYRVAGTATAGSGNDFTIDLVLPLSPTATTQLPLAAKPPAPPRQGIDGGLIRRQGNNTWAISSQASQHSNNRTKDQACPCTVHGASSARNSKDWNQSSNRYILP